MKAAGITFTEVDIEHDPAGGAVRNVGQPRESDRADAEVRRRDGVDEPQHRSRQGQAGM